VLKKQNKMNLQENIQRIKEVMGLITEEEKSYSRKNRIILIGPPTVGKSTVAEELSNQLGIEYVKLDKLQEKFGYGDGKELEVLNYVFSPDFEKYNTPSVLDFGGGHAYNENVYSLLDGYPNVILLMPSKDDNKSNELLRKGNYERWAGFMGQIINGLQSGNHKHSKEKEQELINRLERMKRGEAGKIEKEDLPDVPEMQGWGGLNMDKDWDKYVPLSSDENDINKDLAKHTVPVYDENGNRRNKTEIAKDIIELLT
jgi:hypothetical protein